MIINFNTLLYNLLTEKVALTAIKLRVEIKNYFLKIHILMVGKISIKNQCMILRCRRTQIILHNYLNVMILALGCKRAWNWSNLNRIKIEYQLLNWIQIKMMMMIMIMMKITMKKIMMAMMTIKITKGSFKIMISWVIKQSYKSQRVLYQSQILMKIMIIIKLALIVPKIDR